MKAATYRLYGEKGKNCISIHAAREGGDLRGDRNSISLAVFQSTPPVKAATAPAKVMRCWTAFQSTPPVKAATLLLQLFLPTVRFQSTPPVKAATKQAWYKSWALWIFQSTPPVKAATRQPRRSGRQESISIHAAREGGDVLVRAVGQRVAISIHAAREGGDGVHVCVFLPIRNFNPRRP